MEEQSSSGSAERQVAEFVENDEVGIGEPPRNLAGFSLELLLFESVDEFDGGEEPYAFAVMLEGLDADRGGQMRFACPGRRPGRYCGRPPGTRTMKLTCERFVDLAAAKSKPAMSR